MPYMLVISVKGVCNMRVDQPPNTTELTQEYTFDLKRFFHPRSIADKLESITFIANSDDPHGYRLPIIRKVLLHWYETIRTNRPIHFSSGLQIDNGIISLVICKHTDDVEAILANTLIPFRINTTEASCTDSC